MSIESDRLELEKLTQITLSLKKLAEKLQESPLGAYAELTDEERNYANASPESFVISRERLMRVAIVNGDIEESYKHRRALSVLLGNDLSWSKHFNTVDRETKRKMGLDPNFVFGEDSDL